MDSTASDPQTETPAETAEAVPAAEPEPVAAAPVAEVSPPVEVTAAAPALAVNAGVGLTLRAAREAMGKSLPECAKLLRIRQPFLEALEEGRHSDLPGGTYAAGFLRTYSEFLSLDSEEMVRRFRQEGAGGFSNRTELTFPSPVSEGRIPGGAVIFLGLILAAVAYGGWYLLSSGESKVTEMVPPLPDRLSSVLNRQASLTGDAKAPGAEPGKPAEDMGKVKEDMVPPPEAEEEKPAEAAKVEPPKVEPLKAEAPKAEAPKVEPVKVEAAKVEAPKVEPVKVEPPKVEPAKTEPPKVEPAKAAPAKVEAPKPEAPKVEAPKVEPAKAEPPKVEPAKVEPAKPEAPKPEAAKVEPAPAAAAADGKTFGTEFADSRVVLKATGDDCWIQVRELDGSLLMSRLLRRGDSYRVPNRPGLNLMVGNAGSLEVTVDGRKSPALGAQGQVRRDIRLDPDKLLTGG